MANYDAAQRKEMAEKGWALPDWSYPIATKADVAAAVSAYNLSSDKKPEDKAHIVKRAKALDATDELPDSWNVTSHAEPAGVETIADVELVKAGNWASAASGRVQITGDDLDAMVSAAQDSEVDQGPVKIGHVDPRFDGEPAVGWVRNVRRVGDLLLGDLTDVPAKFASVVRHAYPRRSVEIAWGVRTPGGKTYKAALAGLALLGVTPPAVKGLADIVTRYSGPTNAADDRGHVTVIDGDDSPGAEVRATALSAVAEHAASLDGQPSQARVIAALSLLASDSGVIPQESSDDRRNVPASATKPEDHVNDQEVRDALGLGADIPVTDQLRKIAEDTKTATDAKAKADQDAADAKAKADADAKAAADALNKPTETADAPLLTVDKAALDQLMADAKLGAQAMKILADQDRDKELASALSAGRIAPASVEIYKTMWDTDPEKTKTLLSTLPQVYSTTTQFSAAAAAPGQQPAGAPDDLGFTDDQWDKFSQSLFLKK